MTEWVLVADQKDLKEHIVRWSDSNIFKIEGPERENQLVRIDHPDHKVFNRIMIDFPIQMVDKAIREIRSNQIERYDEIDLDDGYIVVDGDKIDIDVSELSEEEQSEIVAQQI